MPSSPPLVSRAHVDLCRVCSATCSGVGAFSR
ncbi:putative leader peptide [Streptomyces sp. G45]